MNFGYINSVEYNSNARSNKNGLECKLQLAI